MKGITRSLEIMIDSATLATITIAVAADSPPTKPISVMAPASTLIGR
jgi:hypothetical protein